MNRRDVLKVGAVAAYCGFVGAAAMESPRKPIVIAGDSIGVGMALAAGLPYVAKVGVRATDTVTIFHQLADVPPGHRVVLSLGTNDAYQNVDPTIVLAAARYYAMEFPGIWLVGPPRMANNWDDRAAAVDAALLGERRYVSLRGLDVSGFARDPSGVHFTPKGYAACWDFVNRRIG